MPTADIHGTPLVVTDSGGDGPPVVFCPGETVGGGPGAYGHQIDALSEVYRVISWRDRDPVGGDRGGGDGNDGRGRGDGREARSESEAAGLPDVAGWHRARLLFDLLDALAIERAVLCGEADAAALIVRAALLHPDRVRALVLIHADLSPTSADGSDDDHLEARLDELAMPVLLIHGDGDADRPVAWAHAVADVVSDPRGVVEVPGATTDVATAYPELVTDAIRDHLEGLPA